MKTYKREDIIPLLLKEKHVHIYTKLIKCLIENPFDPLNLFHQKMSSYKVRKTNISLIQQPLKNFFCVHLHLNILSMEDFSNLYLCQPNKMSLSYRMSLSHWYQQIHPLYSNEILRLAEDNSLPTRNDESKFYSPCRRSKRVSR